MDHTPDHHDELFVPIDDSALFSSSPADVTFEFLRHTGHKGFLHPSGHAAAVRLARRWVYGVFTCKTTTTWRIYEDAGGE